MLNPASREMEYYDIYPKVFLVNKETEITIRPLGWQAGFIPGMEYRLTLRPATDGDGLAERALYEYKVKPNADGCLVFKHTAGWETEIFVRIYKENEEDEMTKLAIYALEQDMAGKYPFIGDLHIHSRRSDGQQAPAIVCANYRKWGYDFFAVTDHGRYYPSLEAQNAYKDVPIDFNIVEGEEVHLPGNPVHIINFGGDYSVNGLVQECWQFRDKGESISDRAIIENPPKTLTTEEFKAEVNALAEELDIPEHIDKFIYAACVWAFRHIQKGNGLAVYCHPFWITDAYQIAEKFTDYMLDTMPCDAFEVLGGELYFEHNGFQTAQYHKHIAMGQKIPVVGSSDSHNSIYNPSAYIGSTLVFAPSNDKKEIINAVKTFYNVTVDRASDQRRLVGDFRFVKYGNFLMKYYFPVHDEYCFEEGRAMKAYVTGSDDHAAEDLKFYHGRTQKLLDKYFDIEL